MLLRRLIILFVLTAWSQPSFSNEDDAKDIDWKSQDEIIEVLPLIQQLYKHSKSSSSKNLEDRADTQDDINIEVISDYAWLIAFARTRPRTFPRPSFKKGREAATLINLETYEEHYHKVPENITLFHHNSGCTPECVKMLFENRVKSVTIANPKSSNAVRYFKSDCETTVQQGFRRNKYTSRRGNQINNNPVLGLCLDKGATEMPATGFYFGSASPLWPEAYSQIGSLNKFPERPHIGVQLIENNHWAARQPYSKKLEVIFERACFKTTPALPKAAIDILSNVTKKVMDKKKQWGQGYTISGTDQGFCYYPEWGANIGTDSSINFFPKIGDTHLKLDLRAVMSPEQLVEKLQNYKFDPKGTGDTKQIQARRFDFRNTLIYLSSEHPDYYDKVFPSILPRIFDSSSEGLGDTQSLVELFHEAKPPIGSLSDYSHQVETLFEARLKEQDCADWKCPDTKEIEGKQFEFYNMIVGLGRSAFPLLEKMEKAGMKNTTQISRCIGGLSPSKKAKYYSTYKDRVSIGVAVLPIKDIILPETKPEAFIAGRFFDDVAQTRTGKSFTMSNNLGYATNKRQIYFFDGIHPDIKTYLEKHKLMKKVRFIERQNYDNAEALLTTEHGIEVIHFLENKLKQLESEEVKPEKANDIKLEAGYHTKTTIHGMKMNELATHKGQHLREISIVKSIIEKYYANSDTCEYRPTKPFVFFP